MSIIGLNVEKKTWNVFWKRQKHDIKYNRNNNNNNDKKI